MSRRKVLRTCKSFFLASLVVTLLPAQEEAHRVQLNLQGPTQVRYRLNDQQPWVELGTCTASQWIHLPIDKVYLQLSQEHGLWADVANRTVLEGETYLTVRPEDFVAAVHWERVLGIALAAVLLLVALMRSLKGKGLTGTNLEPLIRPDGKVPRRKVGKYRFTSVLGTGGMGVVYQAEDDEGHLVAIKVPAPHLVSQDDFHQRFLREIKLGLDLRHPRVVKVLELPLDEELYVVMEYVEGTPLDKVPIQPWSIEWRRCLTWAAHTLEALAYIHSQGVIHRDMKPSNLMVLPDNSVKLMDFGIAHKVHGTRLTGTDSVMGTPTYMAPEQLQGAEVDPRADLFSLGLILYERLKPGLPYTDELVEMLRQKVTQPMAPLRDSNPAFPSAFDEFIMNLLAMHPDDRFPDAQTALNALQPLLTLTRR